MKKTVLFLSLLSLSACATARDPMPIPLSDSNDAQLSCAEIYLEYKTNTETAAAKIAKNIEVDKIESERGCLIWPRLPDFKNADGIEGNALLDRNVRLRKLADLKKCNVAKYPEQPRRYE